MSLMHLHSTMYYDMVESLITGLASHGLVHAKHRRNQTENGPGLDAASLSEHKVQRRASSCRIKLKLHRARTNHLQSETLFMYLTQIHLKDHRAMDPSGWRDSIHFALEN